MLTQEVPKGRLRPRKSCDFQYFFFYSKYTPNPLIFFQTPPNIQDSTPHFKKAGKYVGVARQLITNTSCSFEPGNLWPVDITTPANK